LCGLAVLLKGGKWSLDERRGGDDGESCADSSGMLEREKEEEGKSEMISPLS